MRLHDFHRAAQRADEAFANAMGSVDLSARQFAVLLAISSFDGMNQTRAVGATGIDRSTLSEVVRRLETKGLITRRRLRNDTRAFVLKLTENGREVLSLGTRAAEEAERTVLGRLPASKRQAFVEALALVAAPAE
jgi:DNA-binding MarR family transcriptional regulator